MASPMTFTKKLKNKHKSFTTSLPKIAEKTFSNVLYKACINVIPNSKQNYKPTSLMMIDIKILNK